MRIIFMHKQNSLGRLHATSVTRPNTHASAAAKSESSNAPIPIHNTTARRSRWRVAVAYRCHHTATHSPISRSLTQQQSALTQCNSFDKKTYAPPAAGPPDTLVVRTRLYC